MDIIGDSTLFLTHAPAVAAVIVLLVLLAIGLLIWLMLPGPDADVVTSVTPGSNTGTGTCTQVYGGPDAVAETITVTLTNATTATVVGGTSGSLANATVGTLYQSAQVEFLLTAGGTAFANNDTFAIITTERTYADVDGGAFTGLTTAASIQKKAIDFDKSPRYLRINYTLGGTVSPAYTVAIAAQSLTN